MPPVPAEIVSAEAERTSWPTRRSPSRVTDVGLSASVATAPGPLGMPLVQLRGTSQEAVAVPTGAAAKAVAKVPRRP